MFTKILIANRGEIACRIIRTAQCLGIKTVAVYSDADRYALHVKMADEAISIGPPPPAESYLAGEKIVSAALKSGAQAIHPGYGFLSENTDFCQLCTTNNIVFIGPSVEAITAMGSKSTAKKLMQAAKVPTVPGYHGDDQCPSMLKKHAQSIGYPVLLKASAGGGGKGMRAVLSAAEFEDALTSAKRESMTSFGDDQMLIEKYLTRPRHVEIQIFCDSHGNGVYLFERDCSIQRRHQKVIEEAPAPNMATKLRQRMGEAALAAAKAIEYEGAGTVEFLLDSGGEFFFMEMNTRLQVEHPVTEMITQQDLVAWQLRVANGEPLPLKQDDLNINGHAFEARIYAEDPDNNFLPATGRLNKLVPPLENDHVRVDTGVIQGDSVDMYYDPMIAKLIVWDKDRSRALIRLKKALSEYKISGVTTNIGFLYNIACSTPFNQSDIDTDFINQNHQEIFRLRQEDIEYAKPIAAAAHSALIKKAASEKMENSSQSNSPWQLRDNWGLHLVTYHLWIQGAKYSVSPELQADLTDIKIVENEMGFSLFSPKGHFKCHQNQNDFKLIDDIWLKESLTAPMNGTIVAISAKLNSRVNQGDTLVIMEAMKMEHKIIAPADGRVKEFYFNEGDIVDGGTKILAFEAKEYGLP